MGKKKKKTFTNDDEFDEVSTDEEKEPMDQTQLCPHVGKAVNVSSLKKALKAAWIRIGACGPCAKDKRQQKQTFEGLDVWMCLKCGVQACGSKDSLKDGKGHAQVHYKTPRSDLHCIFVNVNSWNLFCFECQEDLYIDSFKKLREAVELVKKVAENKHVNKSVMTTKKPTMTKSNSVTTFNAKEAVNVQKARGLTNLGNTCFFNAVMQCLTQSHALTQVLDPHCSKGAPFTTPDIMIRGAKHSDDSSLPDSGICSEMSFDEDSEQVDPLSLQLNEAGPVTLALAAFLKDMHSVGKSGTMNPGHLFGQVCRRSPQFRGFQQQDSHELLRHLMDSLRTEEVKRQKTAILKHFGLSEKTDPKTVQARLKRKLQALGRYSNYTLIDKLFGGQLVSTIVCEQCHNSSQIYEPFLDISLPLVEEKPHKPNRNNDDQDNTNCFGFKKKKDNNEEGVSSNKKLSKRAKAQAKAANRRNKKLAQANPEIIENEPEQPTEEPSEEPSKIEEETQNQPETLEEPEPPKEVEENEEKIEKDTKETEKKMEATKVSNRYEALVKASKTVHHKDGDEEDDEDDDEDEEEDCDWEWDYGDGEEDNDKEEKAEEVTSDYIEVDVSPSEDSTVPKLSLNPLPPERLIRSSEEREKSSEPPDENEDSETGSNGDIEDNLDDHSKPDLSIQINNENSDILRQIKPFLPDPDRLDPHMEALCKKVRKFSVSTADPNGDSLDNTSSVAKEYEVSDGEKEDEKHFLRLQNDWIARSLTSIAPRYHAQTGECTIQSCLAQFTAPELLTGPNKWACDKCTRLHAEMTPESTEDNTTENTKPKTIYSNASKQLLIFCPPGVLTIHLKRFQQTMYNLRKVNKHVGFPINLNLAPFCSTTSLSMSNVPSGATEILYTLFGVVEHSGRLGGGHYTAFVKLRTANGAENFAKKFYSTPTAKNEEIHSLLAEIVRKSSVLEESPDTVEDVQEPSGKWYHISDASVSEVSEERVLKCQAYLLFYERVK